MLPAELPLSLARTVVPAPPPMAQESQKAVDVHQGRTPHLVVPAAASNALATHAVHAKPLRPGAQTMAAAQDQTGNAAVAEAAKRAMPVVPLSVALQAVGHPGR